MNRQTTVGLFVLGGLALALAALVMFGNFHLFTQATRAIVVFQGSVRGLSVGAPVTFRGVRVGAVTDIAIQFDPGVHAGVIPVTIELDPERVRGSRAGRDSSPLQLANLIDHGLRAELNLQSFVTGQSEIELGFDPGSPATLHPDVSHLIEIPTRQSAIQKAQETLAQLPLKQLADNANATVESVRLLSEALDRDLPRLIASIQATSDRSRDTLVTANQAVAGLEKRLDRTLDGIDRLTAASARQVDGRGDDLHALLVSTDQTMRQMRAVMADLRGLTAARSADRANLESTLRDLSAAAASFRGFAADVERNPQLLLTGRRP